MLKAEYTRRINKSSLIITAENDCQAEKDSIEMFRYNDIPCFLKMEAQRKDADWQFCYDITSRRSLDQLLEYKPLCYRILQSILNSFDQACIQAEDFMISENDILLEPEFIFWDHNTEHIFYCFLPGNQKDICIQFKTLMEYLLQHVDHKDEQAVQLAYGVYQRVIEERTALHNVLNDKTQFLNIQIPVRQEPASGNQIHARQEPDNNRQTQGQQLLDNNKSIPDWQELNETESTKWIPATENNCTDINAFEQQQQKNDSAKLPLIHTEHEKNKNCLKSKMKKTEKMQESIQSEQTDPVSKIRQKETLRKQASEKLKHMLRKKIYTDKVMYTEEDTVFEADDDEIISSNPTVCLIPESDHIQNQFIYQGADRSRDFHCPQGKLLLGSDMEESDIYIPFPMVSRVHARIEIDVQGTFLEDMNSTNGTHVNGELLQYREKRMLQKGDIISLAGECYSFH